MRRKKTIHGISEVSDPPWHEQALLTSQSRQIRVERRWMRHFDPTTDSRREQSQARRSRSQEIDSVFTASGLSSVQGRVCSLKQSLPGVPVFRLCYETCGSTRTEQTWDDCYSAQPPSLPSQLQMEARTAKKRLFKNTTSLHCLCTARVLYRVLHRLYENAIVRCHLHAAAQKVFGLTIQQIWHNVVGIKVCVCSMNAPALSLSLIFFPFILSRCSMFQEIRLCASCQNLWSQSQGTDGLAPHKDKME